MTPNTQITPETVGMLKAGTAITVTDAKGVTGPAVITKVEYDGAIHVLVHFPHTDSSGDTSDSYEWYFNPEDVQNGGDYGLTLKFARPAASSPSAVGVGEWRPTAQELENCRASITEARGGTKRMMGERLPSGMTEVLIDADWLERVCDHFATPTPAPSAGDAPVDWTVVGPKLVEEREALRDMLVLILPLAKGYAAANRVGSNAEYVQAADDLLAHTQPQSNGE